jgi:hypothetical protein
MTILKCKTQYHFHFGRWEGISNIHLVILAISDSDKATQHIDRVSLNAAKEAGVDTSRLFTGGANLTKYDIPLDHLDFKYIEGCNDVKELEKIYKILK